ISVTDEDRVWGIDVLKDGQGLVTADSSGVFRAYDDVTELEMMERRRDRVTDILARQELNNALLAGDAAKAVRVGFRLGPKHLRRAVEGTSHTAVEEAVADLGLASCLELLNASHEWAKKGSRGIGCAMIVAQAVFKEYGVETVVKAFGARASVPLEGMLKAAEKGMDRLAVL
ncbi:hypothetical protein KIPB_012509, partial [Kipferlia bialata]